MNDSKTSIGVIIIGFKYIDHEIQCTLYDIFRIYDFYTSLGYPCYVLTDLANFGFDKNIYNTILRNHVDQKLIDFIDQIKRTPSWYKYTYDYSTLKTNILGLPKFDLCITYYSGHGRKRGIELPAGDILNYVSFRTLLSDRIKDELIMIMDCCHVNNMGLLYGYEDNMSRCYFSTIEDIHTVKFSKPYVLIIASSDTSQKSAANRYTSLFTKYLLEYLNMNEQRSFKSLIEYIHANVAGHDTQNNQSVKIYSSNNIYPIVPSYLFQNVYLKIHITLGYLEYIRL